MESSRTQVETTHSPGGFCSLSAHHYCHLQIVHSIVWLYICTFYQVIMNLPWNLYYTFVLEARHGFNKQVRGGVNTLLHYLRMRTHGIGTDSFPWRLARFGNVHKCRAAEFCLFCVCPVADTVGYCGCPIPDSGRHRRGGAVAVGLGLL